MNDSPTSPTAFAADSPEVSTRLVIKGLTKKGQLFRPSDWAQRLATAAAAGQSTGRLQFHPMVRVGVVDGVPSVTIDQRLASSDPRLYAFLRNFATDNDLQMLEENS